MSLIIMLNDYFINPLDLMSLYWQYIQVTLNIWRLIILHIFIGSGEINRSGNVDFGHWPLVNGSMSLLVLLHTKIHFKVLYCHIPYFSLALLLVNANTILGQSVFYDFNICWIGSCSVRIIYFPEHSSLLFFVICYVQLDFIYITA